MKMQAFAILARLHRIASNKNYIGQLIQNSGVVFSLLGKPYENGVDWRSIKKDLDKSAKEKSQTITWPAVFERLGSLVAESDLGKLIIAYAVGMLSSKLAIRDILTAEMLVAGFPDENGQFSPKLWDSWAKENKYTVHVKDKNGNTVNEFVPSGKLLSYLIDACQELNSLAGYHSMDSVADREAGGFDISQFEL